MANLLIDLTLTSSDVFGDTFADILGMSDTVAVAGTSSVVILMTSNVPDNDTDDGDACAEYRFTVDGSPVGPELSAFHDTDSELSGREIIFAVDGLSAGNHDFAVQARNRTANDAATEVTIPRTFQVIEITSGASIIVDLAATDVDSAPVAWANVSGLSGSATPQAGSVLLMLAGVTIDDTSNDEAADFRFAIDGARDGPYSMSRADNVNEMDSASMAWAVDGVSAASHTFSVQWQALISTADTDNGRTRILQVIEFEADVDLLVDEISVASDTAPGTFADMVDMSGSPDIDSIGSIALVLANYVQGTPDTGDNRADSRLTVGGVFEGAVQLQFADSIDLTASTLMARAFTGESGVTDFAMEWEDGKGGPVASTARERTFQVLDIKAGGIQASGSPSITKPTSTGNAIVKKLASGAPSITKPTSTGNAIRKIVASGAPSITKPISAGNAIVKPLLIASGAPSINKPTSQGNVIVCRQASGAPSITKPTSTGNAIVIPIIPPDEPGSTVFEYGQEDQIRKRLEIEDDDNLAIVIAATTAIFDDLD